MIGRLAIPDTAYVPARVCKGVGVVFFYVLPNLEWTVFAIILQPPSRIMTVNAFAIICESVTAESQKFSIRRKKFGLRYFNPTETLLSLRHAHPSPCVQREALLS